MPVYLRQDSMNELLDDVSYEGFEAVRNKLIIAMLYHTGMRRAELIGLRDTDVREGEIKVTGKRNKQRLIPYGEELSQMIAGYRQARKESCGDDCIFRSGKWNRCIRQALSSYWVVFTCVEQTIKEVRIMSADIAPTAPNNGATSYAMNCSADHSLGASTEVYI